MISLNKIHLRIQQLILFFWSLWFSFIMASNTFDYLKAVDYLSKEWKFASGNFEAMLKTTEIYHTPRTFVLILLLGVIFWQIICTFFFWRAFIRSFSNNRNHSLYIAFFLALSLFASFAISTEIFIDYETEETFIRIFTALLLSFFVSHHLHGES